MPDFEVTVIVTKVMVVRDAADAAEAEHLARTERVWGVWTTDASVRLLAPDDLEDAMQGADAVVRAT